jgi:hypothetical protein
MVRTSPTVPGELVQISTSGRIRTGAEVGVERCIGTPSPGLRTPGTAPGGLGAAYRHPEGVPWPPGSDRLGGVHLPHLDLGVGHAGGPLAAGSR